MKLTPLTTLLIIKNVLLLPKTYLVKQDVILPIEYQFFTIELLGAKNQS
ncbi:hypothetical protein NIES4101_35540 [Calothrix sp. NIES-4101]|nr:hypothetical protein NIES4101_35540 [Calothrix sp. NIES-4101]